MVRFCDQCGNQLKEKAIFCSKCGAKCDLPPETNVENETTNNYESFDKHENGNTETIGTKIDNVINKTNAGNDSNDFDFNNIDLNTVLKFSVVGTIISLILGIIFFFLFLNTTSTSSGWGLSPYSFILAVILAVVILTAHIREKINAIIVGLAVGLLTGILQFTTMSIFFGINELVLSVIFGNPTFVLMIVGIVSAYISNVYLSDKINIPIIIQYLGE